MSESFILDNSKRSTYRQCKMKYYLQHIKGLQPNFGSTALRYGSTWHAIQEGYYSHIIKHGWPESQNEIVAAISAGLSFGMTVWDRETKKRQFVDDYKNFNTAANAFNEYLAYFIEDKNFVEVIATEKKFECEFLPENSLEEKLLSMLPPVKFTGKIDLEIKMDEQNWILDFKTTGWILNQIISKANRSPQFIGYSYAGKHALDFEPVGCLGSFAYIGSTKSKVTGLWGKIRSDFRRVPQIYTKEDLSAWKLSFIDTCLDIQRSTKENLWPESFDNCHQYGACPYLKLCQQHKPFEELYLEGYHEEFWDVLEEG